MAEPHIQPGFRKSLWAERLEGRNFAGADLQQTYMNATHFERANLGGADFTGSYLGNAYLEGADLSHARGLGTVNFGTIVHAQRVNFQHADLRNARLSGYFEEADFRHADLRGAILNGHCDGAQFDDADVRDALLLGAKRIQSQHADLQRRGAIVTADDFARALRAGRDFRRCDLSQVELSSADLDGASLEGVDLSSSELRQISLRRAQLSKANLCHSDLSGAALREAQLAGALLVGADLTAADLSQAQCRGTDFGNAKLRGAKLIDADLTGADLRQADLTGADLSGAVIDGVKWDAAIIEDVRGLAPEVQAGLKTKAARWKYDLDLWFHNFVRDFSMPGWCFTWIVGAVVLLRGWSDHPKHLSLKLFVGLHAVAGLPALSILFLFLAEASPVAQLSGSHGGWSSWVAAWPMAFGLSGLAFVGFIPIAGYAWFVGRCREPRVPIKLLIATTIFTGLALVASCGAVMLLAPTA